MSSAAFQDTFVWQFFGCRHEGFFIEAGANGPIVGSLPWLLEQYGWPHLNNWYMAQQSRFQMTGFGERLRLWRKVFFGHSFRKFRHWRHTPKMAGARPNPPQPSPA